MTMIRRATLNVSLTPELVTYVIDQVESGRYSSASEVVRASLRLLQEKGGNQLPTTAAVKPGKRSPRAQ